MSKKMSIKKHLTYSDCNDFTQILLREKVVYAHESLFVCTGSTNKHRCLSQ